VDSSVISIKSNTEALASLREHFGFDDFREGQLEVIQAVTGGADALVIMPTGSGKSLCYQLPAMMLPGATIVVSPLIALMKDQVDALQARGLPATFINSSIGESEQRDRIEGLRRGAYKLVYVAPERFRSTHFLSVLKTVKLSLFAVDEAHCVSTWGHDFRPDYLQLKGALQSLGKPQTLALSATATPHVRSDIVEQLGLKSPRVFVSGFDRPNLSIKVVDGLDISGKLQRIANLAANGGSGIVYAVTRKAVDEVGTLLKSMGLSAASYHAGMSDKIRIKAQEDFMTNRAQMIVATNAFGMGIDKPDIRFVVHYQMPGSIEAYYQEIGRAGRDGLPSSCQLFFNYFDREIHEFFIEGSFPDISFIKAVYDVLAETKVKIIRLAPKEIAATLGERNESAIRSALNQLERAGHIELTGNRNRQSGEERSRIGTIVFRDEPPVRQLRVEVKELTRRAEIERRKLREMVDFCYSHDCYRGKILHYFGDPYHLQKCGICSNCRPGKSDLREPRLTTGRQRNTKPKRARRFIKRELTDSELLRVRKILACAKRMRGKYGKNVLAATLRGSAAKNILKFRLNELSTYGLLKDMVHDEILVYVDALVTEGCLETTDGDYPTVSVTPRGELVMREQELVDLPLPRTIKEDHSDRPTRTQSAGPTMLMSHALYKQGLTPSQIAEQRGLTVATVEDHLISCLLAGFEIDLTHFVSTEDIAAIEAALKQVDGTRLRPLRDVLPERITYNMMRFVIARQGQRDSK
jgi:ATP-dependent DNA helicase RecQ